MDLAIRPLLIRRAVLLVVALRSGCTAQVDGHEGVRVLSFEEDVFEAESHLRQQFNWLTDQGYDIHAFSLSSSMPFKRHRTVHRNGRAVELPLCVVGHSLWKQRRSPEARRIRQGLLQLAKKIVLSALRER